MLAINRHNLDAELEVQADVMERISAEMVKANTAHRQTKDDLARIEGELSSDLKGEKTNAEERAARIKRNPARQTAWRELQEAQAMAEQWQGLYDSWKQRGYSIKTLSDLYAANYFTVSSHTAPQQAGREALQHQRESRHDRAAAAAIASAHEAGVKPRERIRRRVME